MNEIVNIAQEFCSDIEEALQDGAPSEDDKDLRTKLGLCRNLIEYARQLPSTSVESALARDTISKLITAMTWVTYYARNVVKYKVHRKLVTAQALFAYALVEEIPKHELNGEPSGSQLKS